VADRRLHQRSADGDLIADPAAAHLCSGFGAFASARARVISADDAYVCPKSPRHAIACFERTFHRPRVSPAYGVRLRAPLTPSAPQPLATRETLDKSHVPRRAHSANVAPCELGTSLVRIKP
jgi:hypothetical protein